MQVSQEKVDKLEIGVGQTPEISLEALKEKAEVACGTSILNISDER